MPGNKINSQEKKKEAERERAGEIYQSRINDQNEIIEDERIKQARDKARYDRLLSPPFYRIDLWLVKGLGMGNYFLSRINKQIEQSKTKETKASQTIISYQQELEKLTRKPFVTKSSADNYKKGSEIKNPNKSSEYTQKHVRKTHMDAAQSKQLVQKAEPLFQQIYQEAFKIYEVRVARQKDGSSPIPLTPGEKILLSQRELVGAVIAHMNHPSSSTQATLERRYVGYVEAIQNVQSRALPFQKETLELLIEAKRLDPELKMDVKTHAAAWSHGSSDNRAPSPSSVSEIQEQHPKSGL